MRITIIALMILSNLSAFSQNIELMGGLNSNNFFDIKKNEGHYNSSYNSDYGYEIMIGAESRNDGSLTYRITLGFEKYGGELTASDGALGGGYTTNAKVDKSVFSLGLYPLNFRIKNKIDLNVGLEFSGLIHEKVDGTSSGWSIGSPQWSYDLNEKYERYSSNTYFGIRCRIAYDFNISDKMVISPQYSYYFGLLNEFDEFPETTKSMRHYFCIGLERKI